MCCCLYVYRYFFPHADISVTFEMSCMNLLRYCWDMRTRRWLPKPKPREPVSNQAYTQTQKSCLGASRVHWPKSIFRPNWWNCRNNNTNWTASGSASTLSGSGWILIHSLLRTQLQICQTIRCLISGYKQYICLSIVFKPLYYEGKLSTPEMKSSWVFRLCVCAGVKLVNGCVFYLKQHELQYVSEV